MFWIRSDFSVFLRPLMNRYVADPPGSSVGEDGVAVSTKVDLYSLILLSDSLSIFSFFEHDIFNRAYIMSRVKFRYFKPKFFCVFLLLSSFLVFWSSDFFIHLHR